MPYIPGLGAFLFAILFVPMFGLFAGLAVTDQLQRRYGERRWIVWGVAALVGTATGATANYLLYFPLWSTAYEFSR